MVRALLARNKTQTRRPINSQFLNGGGHYGEPYEGKINGPEIFEPLDINKRGEEVPGKPIFGIYDDHGEFGMACPYGRPGDQLLVREKYRLHYSYKKDLHSIEYGDGAMTLTPADQSDSILKVIESAKWLEGNDDDHTQTKWYPSIHMPHAASRIQLEITNVRVERLQDCSEEDAIAEGIEQLLESGYHLYGHPFEKVIKTFSALVSYASLWNFINGPGSWEANPWVWVVEFKVIRP